MKAAVLLLFCSLFIFSQSDPDPELNLHIHLPPGEEGSPHIGRGSVTEEGTEGTKEGGLQIHHDDTSEAKSGPTEAPTGITSPPMKNKVVKEQKDKKTNETISFEMEGEVDDQPYVSCGAHYEPTCEDCPHSLSRPNGTSPRLWCNGDCIWKNERCRKKSTKKQVNCGGHSADTCEECTEAGEGNRNWCNGECAVKCLKGENRGCSEPSEWSCVSKDSIEKPEDSSEEVIDPEPSGKSGPLRIEREGGKCLFSCENDGGCKVGWYNYKDGGYGHFFCSPKSSEDGGKCEISKLAPKFCRDCHGTRKRNKYAPCKEPKPVVTCDYSCVRRVCYVTWSKKKGRTTSWGVHPHWNATVPEKCKGQCTKKRPECEFRLKF